MNKSTTAPTLPRVLVVDDDPDIGFFLTHHARQFGYLLDFVFANDVAEGVARLNENCCDAAVIDVMLGGVTGVSLGQEIRKHDKLIPLAYYTNLDPSDPDNQRIVKAAEAHSALYLYKMEFQMAEGGPEKLMSIIDELAQTNPCLPGGVRIDALGFERRLPATPFKVAEPFRKLLRENRLAMRAAA